MTPQRGPAQEAGITRVQSSVVGERRFQRWLSFDAVLVIAIVTGLFVVVFRDVLLPARFSYDGDRIQDISQGFSSGLGDQSYEAVATAYRIAGLANDALLASVCGFALSIAVFLVVRRRMKYRTPGYVAVIVLGLGILLSSAYLGFYSKDVVVLGITLIVILSQGHWKYEILIVAVMLAYASEVRSYWFVVTALYVGCRVIYAVRPRGSTLVLGAVVGALLIGALVSLLLGVSPDYFRSEVNAGRIGSEDAATAIGRYVNIPGVVGGVVNVVLVLFFLVVPLPLLSLGGPYYAALTVLILFVWGAFFRSAWAINRMALAKPDLTLVSRSLALAIAFLTTQALFEPDYGSALRHLTPLFPIILVVVWMGSRAGVGGGEGPTDSSPDGLEVENLKRSRRPGAAVRHITSPDDQA